MLNVAVIGLGDISKIHLPIIQEHPNARLVAVCDIDETLRNHVTGAKFYTKYEEMLDREEIDCVHICLPHHLHYSVTKTCIEKNIHVFLEKPLARNLDEGMSLVKLEEENKDVKVCISLQNRLNETVEELQKIVSSGEYGEIVGLKGLVTWFRPETYYQSKPWRGKMEYSGGGVMINQAIHTLDLIQLFGGKMEALTGSVHKLLDYDVDVEDTVVANIKFSNGATGLFFATIANAENSSIELQVLFEKAKFTIKDSILTKENRLGKKEAIIEDQKLPGSKFYYGASHAKLINHFYTCIKNDTQDYIHAKDALPTMQMIESIYKSSEIKQEIKIAY